LSRCADSKAIRSSGSTASSPRPSAADLRPGSLPGCQGSSLPSEHGNGCGGPGKVGLQVECCPLNLCKRSESGMMTSLGKTIDLKVGNGKMIITDGEKCRTIYSNEKSTNDIKIEEMDRKERKTSSDVVKEVSQRHDGCFSSSTLDDVEAPRRRSSGSSECSGGSQSTPSPPHHQQQQQQHHQPSPFSIKTSPSKFLGWSDCERLVQQQTQTCSSSTAAAAVTGLVGGCPAGIMSVGATWPMQPFHARALGNGFERCAINGQLMQSPSAASAALDRV